MFRNFIFFVICSLVLSGCVSIDADKHYFISYSDLYKVKNKTIYYEVTDHSVITNRINEYIKKALKLKGWEISEKDKASYVYTISTSVDKEESISFHSVDQSVYMYKHTTYPKRVNITIQDKHKFINVYEAIYKFNSNLYLTSIPYILGQSLVLKHLFNTEDFGEEHTLICEKKYDENLEPNVFRIGDCAFVEDKYIYLYDFATDYNLYGLVNAINIIEKNKEKEDQSKLSKKSGGG